MGEREEVGVEGGWVGEREVLVLRPFGGQLGLGTMEGGRNAPATP